MPLHMLTTTDNPYDPETQFDEWYAFDVSKGYDSLGRIARLTHTSNALPDIDETDEIEMAIEEIVRENISGMHIKIEMKNENE